MNVKKGIVISQILFNILEVWDLHFWTAYFSTKIQISDFSLKVYFLDENLIFTPVCTARFGSLDICASFLRV